VLDLAALGSTGKSLFTGVICFALGWPLPSSAAVDVAPDAYAFCEARANNTHAYVTPVFHMRPSGSTQRFADYLRRRYTLVDVTARCFTLASKRDALQFRTQRIGVLHWNGWQHVVATHWTPSVEADDLRTAAPRLGAGAGSTLDTESG
jgi:hypothetical protein